MSGDPRDASTGIKDNPIQRYIQMMLPSFLVHKRFFKLWRTAVDSQWTNIAIQKSRIVVLFIILGPSTASGQSLPVTKAQDNNAATTSKET